MGLFSKVFSKEACIACGKEAGSLSRKRLGDESIVCKDCAKGLSPFFDGFKDSTADDIRAQLDARERNRAALPAFHVDESFGEGDLLLIDRQQGLFCVVGGRGGASIESGAQLVDANPDLIEISAIRSVEIEGAGHSGREVKRTENGEQVSYDPRRYEYPCNVRLRLTLDHPYVKAINADMTNGTVYIQTEGERLRDFAVLRDRSAGEATADWLTGLDRRVENVAEAWEDNSLEAQMRRPFERAFGNALDDHPDYAYGFKCSRENWPRIQEYGRCMQAAERAREALLSGDAGASEARRPSGLDRSLPPELFEGIDDAAAQSVADACGMRVRDYAAGEAVVASNAPTAEAAFVARGRVAGGMEYPGSGFVEAMAVEAGHTFLVNEAMTGIAFPLECRATQDSTIVFFHLDKSTTDAHLSDPNFARFVNNATSLL